MQSAWSDEDASAAIERWGMFNGRFCEALALRVYSSRLIGGDASLVLHGGGNTSVKTTMVDDVGEEVDVLCVKGSGWDLADIEPAGFPALRLRPLQQLRRLDALSDEAMVNAARTRMLDASAPNPSVEVLLHAFLPHAFIDHSHADAILALVDQGEAEVIAREVFGDSLAIVPYIMPGFALAKRAVEVYEAHPACQGLLLLRHGLFTFGDTARQSYERHVETITKAQRFIASHRKNRAHAHTRRADVNWHELAPLVRGRLGAHERRWVLHLRTSEAVRRFVDHPELATRALRGPATPDHVIRTKRLPVVLDVDAAGDDLAGYVEGVLRDYREAYHAYVRRQIEAKQVQRTPLDADPRVMLIPGLGIVTAGKDAKSACIAADIYEHTISIIDDADDVGRYEALPESDIFDMEYWSLEQAKLGKGGPGRPLERHIVYVTGAACGIGAATARAFAQAGAHLYLVDRDEAGLVAVAEACKCPFEVLDVTDRDAVRASVRRVVETYGGLDGVVSNAGTAPQSDMHACAPDTLQESLAVNLLAHQWVASSVVEIMRAQGLGGFLLFNASKAAFNPGEAFGPYAVAKAGLVALMKQYALENGRFGIRSNAINADRIRTGLLEEGDIEARARARGLSPDAYFRSNLLKQEVTAQDVAAAFVALALARSTTGCVFTVDGGNIAASPR